MSRANTSIRKFLIGSKADLGGIVSRDRRGGSSSRSRVRKVHRAECGAGKGRRRRGLRDELHRALDWDSVALTSRPAAFQHIRDCLTEIRSSGECVLYFDDLTRRLQSQNISFEPGELDTTLGHLSREGQIVDLHLQSGDRVIVLRIDVLSRYAGSIVQAARNNKRGVPVLEQSLILSKDMDFHGLEPDERLESPRAGENRT